MFFLPSHFPELEILTQQFPEETILRTILPLSIQMEFWTWVRAFSRFLEMVMVNMPFHLFALAKEAHIYPFPW